MLNPDTLIERSRFKKQVSFWRALTFLSLIGCAFIIFKIVGAIGIDGEASAGEDFVARINIEGIIMEDVERMERLDYIAKNDKIKAVIVNINSPGGTAVGGETLYNKLTELSQSKPVVSVLNSVAASAAYLTAVGTDKIYSHEGTITGSIGVIMEIPNFRKAAEKLGVDFKYIKTSPLKGAPNLFEENNEKAEKVLKDMMMDFYDYFVEVVKKERKFDKVRAKEVSDGRVFSGRTAVKIGLVDEIGGEKEALAWLVKKNDFDKDIKIREVKLYKPVAPFKKLLESIPESLSMFDNVAEKALGRGLILK